MEEEFWLAEERKEERSYLFLTKDGIKDNNNLYPPP